MGWTGASSISHTTPLNTDRKLFAIRVHIDITREHAGRNSPEVAQINTFADFLVGKNPLARRKLWNEVKCALRKCDRIGMGCIDIALRDFAGRYYDAPIHGLLETYRERLPTHASTGRSKPSTTTAPSPLRTGRESISNVTGTTSE